MRDDQMTAPTSRLRIFTADLIFETSGDALGALAEFREMDFEGEINDVTLDEDGWPSTACVDMYCWSRERLVDLYERVDAIRWVCERRVCPRLPVTTSGFSERAERSRVC